MAAGSHLYEIFVRAPQERVWEALTDPEHTRRYWFGTAFEHAGAPGPYRMRHLESGEDSIDGDIEVFDPPHRLVMTWRVLYDPEMYAEPPGRVEWTLTPAGEDGSITRVTLRHGDLALSPRTWAHVRTGWLAIVGSLKSLLETGEPLPTGEIAADGTADADVEAQWHRAQAVTANNATWELLDGRELDADAVDDLLERAYAAAHHWRRAAGGTDVNRARASWLVSRAHAVCGHGELALHHAERSAAFVAAARDRAADFDHAYAAEARARALACLGRLADAAESYRTAAATEIADEQDRSIFESDLATGPWFDLEPA
jgi:uncharacterized protein YndB with AHSA1/START domain